MKRYFLSDRISGILLIVAGPNPAASVPFFKGRIFGDY